MSRNKQIGINMITSMIALVIGLGINFFLSPYIIKELGIEANGYITLANNFINYASLITITLNSVAGRFITVELHRNQKKEANEYFSSVLFTNIIIAFIFFIVGIPVVIFLDKLIKMPQSLVFDVKCLFAFLFLNFIVTILTSTYGVATFAKNRLDLASIAGTIANIARVAVLISLFYLFKPSVYFVGIAVLVNTLVSSIISYKYAKLLLPEIKVSLSLFRIDKIIELILSGMWNTIIKLGQILSEGLDLLISNLFISATAMGQLAVAQMIPNIFLTLLITISYSFQPDLTIAFAKNDKKDLIRSLKFSMKISALFANVGFAYFVGFGKDFYRLWIPTSNYNYIYILTIIILQGVVLSGVVNPLFSVYTITNKLKVNSFITIAEGILNVVIVFILLKFTHWGLFAVAGVNIIISIIRNLTFTAMYTSHCLEISKKTFYPTIFRSLFSVIILILLSLFVESKVTINGWGSMIISAVIFLSISMIVNLGILLNATEKNSLKEIILKKVKLNKKDSIEKKAIV